MGREFPDRPVVGIGVVVWRAERVVLIRRAKNPRRGEWSLPGGAQKLGETVFEAARREVKEETGLDVEIKGLIDVVDSVQRTDDGRVRYHFTLVDVMAEWRRGKAVAGGDAEAVIWADADDLERFQLWRETTRIIRLAAGMRAAEKAR